MNERIILFDGLCLLCNSWVNFLLNVDKQRKFKFASIESKAGEKLVKKYQINIKEENSVYLIQANKCFSRSTAVFKIIRQLYFPWFLFYVFVVVPSPLRNWVYEVIAKHRYKWFGQMKSCPAPGPDFKSRFLEEGF